LFADKDDYVFTGVAYKANTRVPIIEESQRLAIAVGESISSSSTLILCTGLAQAGRTVTIRDYKDTVQEVRALVLR